MKILHITKKYPKAVGGDAVVVSQLQAQQQKHGHDVATLTSNCNVIEDGPHIYKFGLTDEPAALDSITPRRLFSLISLFFKSFSVIRKERPDIIHTHSVDMACIASIAARFYRVPIIHTFHIVTFYNQKQSALRRKTELLFLKGTRPGLVTVPNDFDARQLREAGIEQVAVLPNGIDLQFWKKPSRGREARKAKAFTFITAARLEDQKGHEHLIQAAALMKKKTKKAFKIIVAGDGSLRTDLEALAREKRVSSLFTFVGNKTPKELKTLYTKTDAAVFASLWETTPLTLLEAWAMGLPAVSTRTGILLEHPEADKLAALAPTGDVPGLADAMLKVLEDRPYRNRLARAGHKAVKQYTWNRIQATAASLYDNVRLAVTPAVSAVLPAKRANARTSKPISSADALRLRPSVLFGVLSVTTIVLLSVAAQLHGLVHVLVTLPLAIITPGLLFLYAAFRRVPTAITTPMLLTLSTTIGLLLIALEGLLLNWLLPGLVHITHPLQTAYLTPLHCAVVSALFMAYIIRSRESDQMVFTINIRPSSLWRTVVPLLLPTLAIIGALQQNNGGSNVGTVMALIFSAGLALLYIIRPRLFNASWLLFCIALALLLSTSLRSWFVSGFDISQEFQVFMMALNQQHWDVYAIPGNAYNACLSLTTLPVALQQFTGISPEYIFKFTYQLVFALTAVVVYAISRQFTGKRIAFLAGMLYIAQAQFIGTMPAIGRQQVGLLFFCLIVYVLLRRKISDTVRTSLLIIASTGMVVMHYSTTYVAILLLTAAAAFLLLHKVLKGHLPVIEPQLRPSLLVKLAALLVLLSFVWYAQMNVSSGNVYTTIRSSLHNLPSIFMLDKGSTKTQLLLGGDTDSSMQKRLDSYRQSLKSAEDIHPLPAETLPLRNESAAKAANHIRDVLLLVLKIVLPLSPLLLLLKRSTRAKAGAAAFVGLGATTVLAVIVVMPVLSVNYNLERVYQQCLVILSLTGPWAMYAYTPAWTRWLKVAVPTAFVLLYFVLTPGSALVNQFTGGSAPRLNLSSQGEDYRKYYTYESEVKGAAWVGAQCLDKPVYADRYGNLRVTAYGGIPFDKVRTNVLQGSKGACLMLDYANVQKNIYYTTHNKQLVRFTTPGKTFDKYNLIYTSRVTKVYQY